MQYKNTVEGIFLARPNRFVALVSLQGAQHVCHVKNTGRCRELLLPGATVVLEKSENPARKTQYDLIAVYKGKRLINMDSQAPNHVAEEYLPSLFPGAILRREVPLGESRIDFSAETPQKRAYIEVKGVTLEENGVAYFPDAPTLRGVKHIRELIRAVEAGHDAMLLFVVQMENISCVRPNERTHPAFAQALREAAQQGVSICAVACRVTPSSLVAHQSIPVALWDDRVSRPAP